VNDALSMNGIHFAAALHRANAVEGAAVFGGPISSLVVASKIDILRGIKVLTTQQSTLLVCAHYVQSVIVTEVCGREVSYSSRIC
jgi:hypothetical protein